MTLLNWSQMIITKMLYYYFCFDLDAFLKKYEQIFHRDNFALFVQFCGKVISCIDIGGESSSLIAAAGSDPILRVWDPRKPGISSYVVVA